MKGFTFIELIVVIGIFAVLTTVALFNFGNFSENIKLSNLASQIALYIKKAQTAGSLGRLPPMGVNPDDLSTWIPAYGVYFSTSDNDKFCYFTDLASSKQDTSFVPFPQTVNCSSTGGLERIDILSGEIVSALKIKPVGQRLTNTTNLYIVFRRPNLSALIFGGTTANAEQAEICITSPRGREKKIIVYSVGQISIKNDCEETI